MSTRNIPTVILSLLLGLAGVSSVSAFKIDFLTTFVPFDNISHIGQPMHEHITRDAITNVTPAASVALIANLQRGVQNADIIHQFDSESHFDNCSVALNVGFSNGFATMNRRFASARPNALNNPEFLAPHCTSFLDISANVVAVLTALANDPECLVKPACPTSRAAAERHLDRQRGAMVFQKDKETVQKLAEVIAEARKELARGDEAAASGQADEAIDNYRDAWKQVLPVKLTMKAGTQPGSWRLALIGLRGETWVIQISGHLKDWIRSGTAT